MKQLLVVFALVFAAGSVMAATVQESIAFVDSLIPGNQKTLSLKSTEQDSNSPCQLGISTETVNGGLTAAYVTVHVVRDGAATPLKFVLAERSSVYKFDTSAIKDGEMRARVVVVPNDQYSSKERQWLWVVQKNNEIYVNAMNERKGWFGYKTTAAAQCSFKMN